MTHLGMQGATQAGTGSVAVRLVSLPIAFWAESRQWFEDVRRELSLAGLSGDTESGRLGRRVTEVLTQHTVALGGDRGSAKLWAAFESHVPRIDIDYVATHDAAVTSPLLAGFIDDINLRCLSGRQLTLPMTDYQQSFFRWYFGELTVQVADGAAPRPWPGPWAAQP